jgi:enamine deaminase RidA (YjgF/YER057c/UK114 family)
MGESKVFQTEKAAITGGPYSQAIIHNDLIYLSG